MTKIIDSFPVSSTSTVFVPDASGNVATIDLKALAAALQPYMTQQMAGQWQEGADNERKAKQG